MWLEIRLKPAEIVPCGTIFVGVHNTCPNGTIFVFYASPSPRSSWIDIISVIDSNQIVGLRKSRSSSSSSWTTRAQELLRRRLILEDDFTWKIPTTTTTTTTTTSSSLEDEAEDGKKLLMLRYVGGVDLSFSKDDPSMACAALVVLDLQADATLNVVYHDFTLTHLHIPYIPGFLAFREAPVLLDLLDKMKRDSNPFYPQVHAKLMVPFVGFGLACHLGVMADLPTIGIGKNLHHVDGLTQSGVRKLLEAKENCAEDLITLTGCSGRVWGAALRSTRGSLKPVFISVGHRISLDTAIKVVKLTCKYRVPEPIRQADIRSRSFLQKNQGVIKKECD
ncbi:Endonuclease V [Macleaya cordata]|uniref:Endonuclease V n=1 Tax=Macleaya cordata TaxID=56857 RepID=A0A200R9D9_MACCD|nr:Endonuclease V [Macleaya cordata]